MKLKYHILMSLAVLQIASLSNAAQQPLNTIPKSTANNAVTVIREGVNTELAKQQTMNTELYSLTASGLPPCDNAGDVRQWDGDSWECKNLSIGTINYTANASPSAAYILAHKFISNYGATGTITVSLPAISYEISRAVVVESAQIIQLAPPSGEAFDLSGTTLTADQSFAGSATVGSKVVITRQRNADGTWIWSADVVRGTWAGI